MKYLDPTQTYRYSEELIEDLRDPYNLRIFTTASNYPIYLKLVFEDRLGELNLPLFSSFKELSRYVEDFFVKDLNEALEKDKYIENHIFAELFIRLQDLIKLEEYSKKTKDFSAIKNSLHLLSHFRRDYTYAVLTKKEAESFIKLAQKIDERKVTKELLNQIFVWTVPLKTRLNLLEAIDKYKYDDVLYLKASYSLMIHEELSLEEFKDRLRKKYDKLSLAEKTQIASFLFKPIKRHKRLKKLEKELESFIFLKEAELSSPKDLDAIDFLKKAKVIKADLKLLKTLLTISIGKTNDLFEKLINSNKDRLKDSLSILDIVSDEFLKTDEKLLTERISAFLSKGGKFFKESAEEDFIELLDVLCEHDFKNIDKIPLFYLENIYRNSNKRVKSILTENSDRLKRKILNKKKRKI